MTSKDDYGIDDEALAEDMRAYLAFVCLEIDPVEYCAALAEVAAVERMEDEGIAAAE